MHARSAATSTRFLFAFALFVVVTSISAGAYAKGKGLKALTAPSKVVFDGLPKEFDTDWRDLSFEAKGSQNDDDIEAKATVCYDDKGFYVAADVTDDKLVGGSDHVELLLGIPGGTLAAFRLYPGVAGKTRAQAKDKNGRKLSGAKIVEAPKPGGYTLEAFIPWKAVPKSGTIRVGYRGGLYVHDADSGRSVETIIGTTSERRYAKLPAVSTMSELALGSGLLRQRNIQSAPRHNLMANVVGDKLLERILVYDRFVVVLGPGYREGQQYYFRDLGTRDVSTFEVKDLTGDNKSDLLIRRKITGPKGSVEVFEVLSYHEGGDTPAAAFAQEIALSLDDGGHIENEVRLSGTGSRTQIRLRPGKSDGIDKARFERASSTGATPVLVPWGTIKSQTFTVKNGAFKLSKEEEKAGEPIANAPSDPAPQSDKPKPRGYVKEKPSSVDPERVYALYKKQRKIKGKARFDVRANLTAGKAKERVVVHGRDLVLFGPEFRGGRGFAAITLSHFEKSNDIKNVTSRDVTGDGKHELVIKGEIRSPLPKDLGKGKMHRSVVLVYKVKGEGLERIFAAEVGRRVGDKRIEAKISFSGSKKYKITLKPGRAVGYSESTYPWRQKTEPDGGFEPLLLPWGGVDKVRLRFSGGQFVR